MLVTVIAAWMVATSAVRELDDRRNLGLPCESAATEEKQGPYIPSPYLRRVQLF